MHLALFLQQSPLDQAQIQKMVIAFMAIIPVIYVVGRAVVIVPAWFICKKAGFSPWLSMLNILPLGGLVLSYVVAFSEWKVVPVPPPGWTPPSSYPPQPPYPPQS
jgi:hypothetical protein